ncbi:MAG TPA: hypothetical protein DDW96_04780 [Synergistaceae bacterium]|nr:hypothetical protein [Synergistaceae bacterium]
MGDLCDFKAPSLTLQVEFATLEWVDRFNNSRLLVRIGYIAAETPAKTDPRHPCQPLVLRKGLL